MNMSKSKLTIAGAVLMTALALPAVSGAQNRADADRFTLCNQMLAHDARNG